MDAGLDPVPLCAALSDASRWEILRMLGAAELSASELADHLPVTRQAIVKHLQQLEAVGLVTSARAGRSVRYRALGGRLSELAAHLEAVGRGWEQRLERLRVVAEGLEQQGD